MKNRILISLSLLIVSGAAGAAQGKIKNWSPIAGLDEEEVVLQVTESVQAELLVSDSLESCGMEAIWGFEKKDRRANKEGPRFMIRSNATGPNPDPDLSCSGTENYECRSYFNSKNGVWTLDLTLCEADELDKSL